MSNSVQTQIKFVDPADLGFAYCTVGLFEQKHVHCAFMYITGPYTYVCVCKHNLTVPHKLSIIASL